jgi:DNA-binding MarR family transcriptional regulator
MIRKSNYSKTELLAAVGRQVQAFQDATDEVDEAVAGRLRLNRTDLRCLSVLAQVDEMSASALADATGLTRGAMTTALDRIEEAGYARRVRDRDDRRTVRVEMTDAAKKAVEVLYGPLAKEGFKLLQTYTTRELAAVLRYLDDGRKLQRAHAQRIRGLGVEGPGAVRSVRGRRAGGSAKPSRQNRMLPPRSR